MSLLGKALDRLHKMLKSPLWGPIPPRPEAPPMDEEKEVTRRVLEHQLRLGIKEHHDVSVQLRRVLMNDVIDAVRRS